MYLKNIFLNTLILFSITAQSQTTITTNKILDKKPVFVGGGLLLGGGAHSFQMGLNPEIIKSFTPYLDGGLAMNIYYELYNPSEFSDIRSRNFRLGIGAFTRIWPIESFFIQVQPEYNYAWIKQKDTKSGQAGSTNFGAESILAGVGYGKRSEFGISYFSVMIDLLNNPQSQYNSGYNRKEPVFRAGIGFPLRFGPKKKQP
ncbi:MAG: hypothetical protein EBU05_05140 [Chitinophagia bacterium]|jgi:hypothetical protein|nr:hypothetical protein [Chitinophagia bacterium]